MLLSRSASMMSMFSSPGMPKMYSTASFSRHLTNSCAAVVIGLQRIVGCQAFVTIGDAVDRQLRYTSRKRLRKLPCRRISAEIAGADLSMCSVSSMACRTRRARSSRPTWSSIIAAARISASGLAMPLPAMSGAPDEARDLVGENVAEEIGRHDDVELPWIEHELHRAGVDDALVDFEAVAVALADLSRGLEEDAGKRLHDVRLVHDRDFPALVAHGVIEGELGDSDAARARIDPRADRYRMRIVADGDVVLVSHVQPLGVFPHHYEVDVFIAAARDQRARRPDVGIEMEFFAQANVRRAVTATGRGRQRPLQGEPGAPDALQRGL